MGIKDKLTEIFSKMQKKPSKEKDLYNFFLLSIDVKYGWLQAVITENYIVSRHLRCMNTSLKFYPMDIFAS